MRADFPDCSAGLHTLLTPAKPHSSGVVHLSEVPFLFSLELTVALVFGGLRFLCMLWSGALPQRPVSWEAPDPHLLVQPDLPGLSSSFPGVSTPHLGPVLLSVWGPHLCSLGQLACFGGAVPVCFPRRGGGRWSSGTLRIYFCYTF